MGKVESLIAEFPSKTEPFSLAQISDALRYLAKSHPEITNELSFLAESLAFGFGENDGERGRVLGFWDFRHLTIGVKVIRRLLCDKALPIRFNKDFSLGVFRIARIAGVLPFLFEIY